MVRESFALPRVPVVTTPNAMTQTIDDIDRQARQGSVAAIIQLLNEHFAAAGIRTRAMLDNGILQLLLEAPTPDHLPQETTVNQVKQVLEDISPRGITRVKINSRIVQEQQLLWLDEIKRDPDNQLIWSEPITLRRPNPLTRLWQDVTAPRQSSPFLADVPSTGPTSSKTAFWRGLMGGASLCLLLGLVGWATKDWLGVRLSQPWSQTAEAPPAPPTNEQDPFVMAVRLAQQSVEDGKTAETASEWLDLALRWQRASDLMAEVPVDDERYAIAQDRIEAYSQNKVMALQRAEQVQADN